MMSEPSDPRGQDAWKCLPGHLGKNPLFNRYRPSTHRELCVPLQRHARGTAPYGGKGRAQPTVNLLVTTC